MYDTLTEFMKTFSEDFPALWALLVMAVVASTSLLLFAFWEVVLRFVATISSVKKNGRRPTG